MIKKDKMNKKAFSPVSVLGSWFLFFIIWVMVLNTQINYWATHWIQTHEVTGLGAFLLTQLNMLILLMSILGAFIGVISS